MAAIKNIITLGIGASPGHLKYFLTLGLDISAIIVSVERTYTVDAEGRTWAILAAPRIFTVDSESRTLEVV